MSRKDIPLQVIYSRVESSGVPLVDPSQNYSVLPSSSYDEPKAQPKKFTFARCCGRICVCLWALFVLTVLGMTIFSLVAGYYQYKGCVHSKNYEMTELTTTADSLKEIRFDVVTGGVVVSTHESKMILVKMYRSAREAELVAGVEANADLTDGVLTISSTAPAFDFHSCQFAYIEVLFPEDFEADQPEAISVTGSVLAGFIEMGFLENLKDVTLSVELGLIEISAINAYSVEVQGGLSYIEAEAVYSVEHAKFAVETGSINTQYVMSPLFETAVKFGSAWNRDISTNSASVTTKYGYSTLIRPSHLSSETDQKVTINTFYGKSVAAYDQFYPVEFEVSGTKGDIGMLFEDSCALDETTSTEDLLVGQCEGLEQLTATSTFKVSATHGNALFIQNEADEDLLEVYPEVLSGLEIPEVQEYDSIEDQYELDGEEQKGMEEH